MKDFLKIFLLVIAGVIFFVGLSLLGKVNPLIIILLRILISVVIIGGGILLFRNKWTHKLPKVKRKEHLKDYKNQFKKNN